MSPLSIVSLRLARAEAGRSGPERPSEALRDRERFDGRSCAPLLLADPLGRGSAGRCARRMGNEQRPTTAKMTASSTRTRKTTTRARAKRNEACEDRLKSVRYREGIRDNSQTRADHRCSLELRPLPASLARSLFPVAFPFFSFAHETNALLLSSSPPSSLPSSLLLLLFSRLFQSRSRDPIHRPGTVHVPSSTRMSPRNHEPRAR